MPKKRRRKGSNRQQKYATSSRKGKNSNTQNLRNMFKTVGTQTDSANFPPAGSVTMETQTGAAHFQKGSARAGTYTVKDRTVEECLRARESILTTQSRRVFIGLH